MKVLLVYPKYPENTFWGFKYILHLIKKSAAFTSLGLLTIAPMFPEDWDAEFIDLNIEELQDKHIRWADMVFVSAMIAQKESALKVIERCKRLDKKVVAGGPLFTSQPEKFEEVDYLVLNEAEITLPWFLEDLKSGKPKHVYKTNKFPDITKTPIPRWDLIKKYLGKYSTMLLQFSRGCPFNCEFCDVINLFGRKSRAKTPEQMIAEVQSLYDIGWRRPVFIVDDNFIGNKKEVKKFLRLLIQWQKEHKYPFQFLTEASINLAEDEELMILMRNANFDKVFIGIESVEKESLKECNKYQNVKVNLAESVKKIHQHGLRVMAGFIFGFDNDTVKTFEAQIAFVQQVGIVTVMAGLLNALPGTQLWNRLLGEGRLLDESSGNNTDGSINFLPKMGMDKLISGYKLTIPKLYSPKHYFGRIDIFVKDYSPAIRGKKTWGNFKSFCDSLWRIGLSPKVKWRYWVLLIKTFFTNRKALPAVVEDAIYWIHYYKVSKSIR